MENKAATQLSDSEILELANLCAEALKKAFEVNPNLPESEAQKVMNDMAEMYALAASMRFPAKNLVN